MMAKKKQKEKAKPLGAALQDMRTLSANVGTDLLPEQQGAAFPEQQAKQIVKPVIDETIDQSPQLTDKEKKNPKIRNQFEEALSFFAPQLIAGAAGALFGGPEAVAASIDAAGEFDKSFRQARQQQFDNQFKLQTLHSKKSSPSKVQQTDFVDRDGNPIVLDPIKRKYLKVDGSVAKQGDFQDPIDARQAKSLAMREKQHSLAEIKLRHGINKDMQLSDKQAERFEGMTAVIDSIDRIDSLQKQVATGLGISQFQSFAEFADAAPQEFTAMKSETNSLLANYVKSISGAQVSEPEAQRLNRIIPSVNDAPEVFNTKLQTFRKIVETNKAAFRKAILTGQPLKKGTIKGLTEAEAALQKLDVPVPKSAAEIKAAMSPEKRKQYEEWKRRRNK